MPGPLYDRIGTTYTSTRRPDPRIERAIHQALGDAQSVINVGAGAGGYEPSDREVVAVEPSPVMIAQRPAEAAPVVRADAERLPFDDGSFDAAMSVLSDHHWKDRRRGLQELARVARRRVVLFNADPGQAPKLWLTAEYLPAFLAVFKYEYGEPGYWERELRSILGGLRVEGVPIPHDCVDGFYGAFWRRPRAYLDPRVRAGISVFSQLQRGYVERGIAALEADLESGAWERRHRDLLALDALSLGYYVVVAELAD
ncbi:MAG TPA: class I SAM-dependent methyltransferase [Solirubrobacteraceae bacterium]|nr:class I SAM-dependent methyltransferase [Solirubrobacteraceae bacterium]